MKWKKMSPDTRLGIARESYLESLEGITDVHQVLESLSGCYRGKCFSIEFLSDSDSWGHFILYSKNPLPELVDLLSRRVGFCPKLTSDNDEHKNYITKVWNRKRRYIALRDRKGCKKIIGFKLKRASGYDKRVLA